MRSTTSSFLGAACALLVSWRAHGQDAALSATATAARAAHIRLDEHGRPEYLARFHDGPRRVPPWDAAEKQLSEELGIGSAQAARSLLWNAPPAVLLHAVGSTRPRRLLWPVLHGRFGRGFGFTRVLRKDLPHNGVDIAAPEGTIVRAAAAGLVVYSDNGLRGFGNCVMILHDGGLLTLYAHNERTIVQAGQRVEQGERIALVGQTGYAWGPHLHFELRDNGRLRDPMPRFFGRNSDFVLVRGQDANAAVPTPPRRGDSAS